MEILDINKDIMVVEFINHSRTKSICDNKNL